MTNSSQTRRSIVPDLGSVTYLDVASSDEADASEVRVERVHWDLLAKKVKLSDGEKEALSLVAAEAYSKIRQVVESSMLAPPLTIQACPIVDGNVGRPHFDILQQQLEYLIKAWFTQYHRLQSSWCLREHHSTLNPGVQPYHSEDVLRY